MRTTRATIGFLLIMAVLMPLAAQTTNIVSVGEYVVAEGDSMYWISLAVYSDAERLDGAHWLSIF
ncbi:MAG: hypothetical protein JXM71_02335, partial [Spirochaetales bacterium]|nr:hypothetical protein [Spirochaetales bacterium]